MKRAADEITGTFSGGLSVGNKRPKVEGGWGLPYGSIPRVCCFDFLPPELVVMIFNWVPWDHVSLWQTSKACRRHLDQRFGKFFAWALGPHRSLEGAELWGAKTHARKMCMLAETDDVELYEFALRRIFPRVDPEHDQMVMRAAAWFGSARLAEHCLEKERCLKEARAAARNQPPVLVAPWMRSQVGAFRNCLTKAASKGHIPVLNMMWDQLGGLHQTQLDLNMEECLTPCLIKPAIRRGTLSVIEWLHDKMPTGTFEAKFGGGGLLDMALRDDTIMGRRGDDVAAFRWICEKGYDRCLTSGSAERIVQHDMFQLLDWIEETDAEYGMLGAAKRHLGENSAVRLAVKLDSVGVLKWLHSRHLLKWRFWFCEESAHQEAYAVYGWVHDVLGCPCTGQVYSYARRTKRFELIQRMRNDPEVAWDVFFAADITGWAAERADWDALEWALDNHHHRADLCARGVSEAVVEQIAKRAPLDVLSRLYDRGVRGFLDKKLLPCLVTRHSMRILEWLWGVLNPHDRVYSIVEAMVKDSADPEYFEWADRRVASEMPDYLEQFRENLIYRCVRHKNRPRVVQWAYEERGIPPEISHLGWAVSASRELRGLPSYKERTLKCVAKALARHRGPAALSAYCAQNRSWLSMLDCWDLLLSIAQDSADRAEEASVP